MKQVEIEMDVPGHRWCLSFCVDKVLQMSEFDLVAELVCDRLMIAQDDAFQWNVHAETSFFQRFPPPPQQRLY